MCRLVKMLFWRQDQIVFVFKTIFLLFFCFSSVRLMEWLLIWPREMT